MKQSELRVKDELATRTELESPRRERAACEAFEGTLKDVVMLSGTSKYN